MHHFGRRHPFLFGLLLLGRSLRPQIIATKQHRRCCLSSAKKAQKIVYAQNGNPQEVLQIVEEQIDANALGANEVFVQWMASPVNPADINMVQGVYAIKPSLPAIGGNEGCARIEKLGSDVKGLKEGDLVIPSNAGIGTWRSHGIYRTDQLFPISNSLDVIQAATIQVNPSTAFRMLKDFVPLSPGDLVVQNGGNSAVGRFVIQFCKIMGTKSISVVRDRPEIGQLKGELKQLGANEVFTEEEFAAQLRSSKIGAKLALNCVGGKSSMNLIRALADYGCMVTYGGMSKNSVQVPTSSLIFNDVILRGFWMSKWYEENTQSEERRGMYDTFAGWYKSGLLFTPPFQKRKLEEFREAVKESMDSSSRSKQIFVRD